MIPILQNDYYKYIQMFRGNFLKGATLFRSLLNDPNTREQLITNLPALSAVFTDFSNSEANRLCYDILSEKSYFDDALIFYLQGIEATTHTTMTSLINDEEAIIELIGNEELAPLFRENLELYKRVLKKQDTLDLLKEEKNSDLMLDDLTLSVLSGYTTRTTTNIYTSYSTYTSGLSGVVCEFDSNENYYAFTPIYNFLIVDDETRQVFLPVQIRTRVGTTSTYYYYPAVFKYDIATATWSTLHVAMTTTKVTSTNKTPQGVAYDPSEDLVYLFYRQDTTVQMNCDIIEASAGTAIMTELNVGSVGTTSYLTAYFCDFDKENGVAKYVWAAGAVNSTSTVYGWLYGCSVNKNGLVWQGIVATPKSERTSYSSEMMAVNTPQRLRCSKGAYVCAFSNTSSSSTAMTLGFIVHSGIKMTSKYIQISANTDYSDFYTQASSMITEDGLLLIYSSSATYQSNTRNVVLAIDIVRGKLLKAYENTTSNTYTLYMCSLLKKVALVCSNDATAYTIIGKDENGKIVELETTKLPSCFNTEYHRPVGSERYKLYTYNASYWYLYDYKGGFTA